MSTPGKYTRNYTDKTSPGGFFGDYCNWDRIPEYKSFFFESPAADLASQLMGSSKVNLFHGTFLSKNLVHKSEHHGIMINRIIA